MKQRGFSLIELMVAVGIMTLINIMIFASYPEFSQKMALKRTSEEVALIARQAQAYALGIKNPLPAATTTMVSGFILTKTIPKPLFYSPIRTAIKLTITENYFKNLK